MLTTAKLSYIILVVTNLQHEKEPTMTITTNGTALIGYTDKGYTPEAIAAALNGASDGDVEMYTADDFFDGKVTMEFVAKINGTTVTIYNYKPDAADIQAMLDGEYEWHVGGFSKDVVNVLNAIGIDSRLRPGLGN